VAFVYRGWVATQAGRALSACLANRWLAAGGAMEEKILHAPKPPKVLLVAVAVLAGLIRSRANEEKMGQ